MDFLAILLPLALLFDVTNVFYIGWEYSLWYIGYTGEYFRNHLSFPLTYNAHSVIGLASPIFYGERLFPLLGILSAWLGASLALRIGVFTAYAIQYYFVCKAAAVYGRDRALGRIVACLSVWAIYPLTNLYNRSAFTEFMATSFLTSAVSAFLISFDSDKAREASRYLTLGILFMALTVGTHPITALLGALVVATLLALNGRSIVALFKRSPGSLGVPAVMIVATLLGVSPWLAALKSLKSRLHIMTEHFGPMWYGGPIDQMWTRLMPLPIDWRSLRSGVIDVSTPYLDAQINLPLLVLALWLGLELIEHGKGRTAFARARGVPTYLFFLVLAGFVLALSVSPSLMELLRLDLRIIQFYYRLISYVNLCLFLAILAAVRLLRELPPGACRTHRKDVLRFCIVTAALAVVVKLGHGWAVSSQPLRPQFSFPSPAPSALLAIPDQFYAIHDYVTPRWLPGVPAGEAVQNVSLGVGIGKEFGVPLPTPVTMQKGAWIVTNVAEFPWNRIHVDGKELSQESLRSWDYRIAFRLEEGAHLVQAGFKPEKSWEVFRALSWLGTAVLFLLPLAQWWWDKKR